MSGYRSQSFMEMITKHTEVAEKCEGFLGHIFQAIVRKDVEEVVQLLTKFNVQDYSPFLSEVILHGNLKMAVAIVGCGCPVTMNEALLSVRRGTDAEVTLYIMDTYLSSVSDTITRREVFQRMASTFDSIARRAVRVGSAELLKQLIVRGLHVSDFDIDFALMSHTKREESAAMFNIYLSNGGSAELFLKRENFGISMLCSDIIDVMLSNGVCPSLYLFTLCQYGCERSTSLEAIRHLLRKGAVPSDRCIYVLAINYRVEHLAMVLPAMTLLFDERPMVNAALSHLVSELNRHHLFDDEVISCNPSERAHNSNIVFDTVFPFNGIGTSWLPARLTTPYLHRVLSCKLLVFYGAEIPREDNPLRDLLIAFRQKVEFSLMFERISKIRHEYSAPRDLTYTLKQFV